MKLTKEQIQYIDNYLIKNEVKYWDVRLELLDYIALAVEDHMNINGMTFDKALLVTHQAFGNQTKVHGIYHGKLLKQGLYADNQGFKDFEKQKQKDIGKKYRRLHWQGLKQLLKSPKFLLEYVLFCVMFYLCFIFNFKATLIIGFIILTIPTLYSGYHSAISKMARRSLNVVSSIGIIGLPWNIYNLVFLSFNSFYDDQASKPYYILFIIIIVCYPLVRSGLKVYLEIFNAYKQQYNLI